jgi:putative nucleotidyltransferase with HDIG domain
MVEADEELRTRALEMFRNELLHFQHLPAAPEIVQQVIALVGRETTNARVLGDFVGRDPTLAARLLGFANSSFVAARRPVTDIGQAIVLLGVSQVRDLVLTASVWGELGEQRGITPARRRTLWVHSATVAAAAKRLAPDVGADDGTAFTAGLLHDVGKLVLGLRLGESYWRMLEQAEEDGRDVADVERETFGCHHGTVGGWLLGMWRLPEELGEAASLHHEAVVAERGVVRALVLADAVVLAAQATLRRGEGLAGAITLPARCAYDGDPARLVHVYDEAIQEADRLGTLLDGGRRA